MQNKLLLVYIFFCKRISKIRHRRNQQIFFILICQIFFCSNASLFAQNITQTIRGKVLDSEAKFPLIGVNVILQDSSKLYGAITNEQGEYRINNVPVGRHNIRFSYMGYKDAVLNNIIVSSAKEVILNVDLIESVMSLDNIEIKASRSGEVQNEMATVSARSFTIDETDRYAGSRGDPARMASNFAGVQGADDSRNDIVIRGNSPQAVLWQLEGINIPNPNHFSIPGTAGGPVSIINNKMLANSDFYTGAFPAEFGNSIAGVFDLKMKNGNNEKHEFSGQLGFLGTELFAEGPISEKNKSSYLISYRYSTLSLFGGLGIPIGTDAIPQYQDGAFRLNFPTKKGGNFSVFGLGGSSKIDIMISDQKVPEVNIYGENDRDQHFKSRMGVVGASYTRPINNNTFLKTTVAASNETVDVLHNFVYRHVNSQGEFVVDSLSQLLGYKFRHNKYSGILYVYKKLNSKNTISFGFNNDLYHMYFVDSIKNINEGTPGYLQFRTRWDASEYALLVQPYVQWKHRFTDKLTLNSGIHSQYFTLSQSLSAFEPRLGLNWNFRKNQSLSFGTGVHSQIQPSYMYFYAENRHNGKLTPHNKNMDFTKSNHFVIAYDKLLGENIRFKAETYYQYLYNIPVDQKPSSFSLVNTGAGFTRFFPDTLVNSGTGENYGIEFTLEKFFSNKYFFLLTASVFESKYRGSDGIRRDTDFNGNYALNGLFTKEFTINKHSGISLGTNITMAGGRRYGPVDEEASKIEREVVFIDETRNSLQMRDYFRADLRINYRLNRPKVTHEIALDLINIFNTKNILRLTYAPNEQNPEQSSIREEHQLGFLPLFYYKVDF